MCILHEGQISAEIAKCKGAQEIKRPTGGRLVSPAARTKKNSTPLILVVANSCQPKCGKQISTQCDLLKNLAGASVASTTMSYIYLK